jgi:transposase, IS6 family
LSPNLKRTNRSWSLDETYITSKGRDRFLYRAVDSTGQTIDFLLTDRRDAAAAKRFFRIALLNEGNSMPRVIHVNKNRAYPRAIEDLKPEGVISGRCRLRRCKYLNSVVEQDHRNVKRRMWLAKGSGSPATAWPTLRGIEAMDMMRKGRVR